jgi:hypothetical protein
MAAVTALETRAQANNLRQRLAGLATQQREGFS